MASEFLKSCIGSDSRGSWCRLEILSLMLIHRRKGYLSAAARALLALMSSASLRLGDERKAKKRP